MNALLIPIILTAAFLLVGCGNDTTDTIPDVPPPTGIIDTPQEPEGPLTVSFADGALSYSARIMVPTPCHNVRVEENILESDPAQIEITVEFIQPEPDVVCAQVIDEREISGTITLGEEPGTVRLVTPFETHEAQI